MSGGSNMGVMNLGDLNLFKGGDGLKNAMICDVFLIWRDFSDDLYIMTVWVVDVVTTQG